MPLPLLCIRLSLTYAFIAMVIGLYMAISGDHRFAVAHAHLAIIGWFGLFSTGMIFRNFTAVAEQGGRWVMAGLAAGTPLLALGVGLLYSGAAWAEPIAVIGSLMIFAATGWLALVLWRTKLG